MRTGRRENEEINIKRRVRRSSPEAFYEGSMNMRSSGKASRKINRDADRADMPVRRKHRADRYEGSGYSDREYYTDERKARDYDHNYDYDDGYDGGFYGGEGHDSRSYARNERRAARGNAYENGRRVTSRRRADNYYDYEAAEQESDDERYDGGYDDEGYYSDEEYYDSDNEYDDEYYNGDNEYEDEYYDGDEYYDEEEYYGESSEKEVKRQRRSEKGDFGKESAGNPAGGGRAKRKRPVLKILISLICLLTIFIIGKNILQGNNWTIAVFGVDARDGNLESGTRSDVIMLVNVNKSSGEIKLVSVFRDTYLKIDDDNNYHKINTAYERGGHEQAIAALEENLDVKIDDYITFSWSAVANGINALGGIDLELSDAEFSLINAFITETVNSTGIGSVQLKSAGMNHLDGVQAVAYGRLRLIDTDFNRTARQRKVISLAMEKAKASDFNTLKNAALAVLPYVSTSIGIDDLLPLIKSVSKFEIGESTGFPFSRETMDVGKLDCVVPTTLESNVVTLHELLFGEENYKPSNRVKEISAHIGEVTGLTSAGENAPEAGTGGGVVYKGNSHSRTEAPQISETAPLESEQETETEAESAEESESAESGEEESGESEEGLYEETEDEGENADGKPAKKPEETEAENNSDSNETAESNDVEGHGNNAPHGSNTEKGPGNENAGPSGEPDTGGTSGNVFPAESKDSSSPVENAGPGESASSGGPAQGPEEPVLSGEPVPAS